jgi:hypothetical protein
MGQDQQRIAVIETDIEYMKQSIEEIKQHNTQTSVELFSRVRSLEKSIWIGTGALMALELVIKLVSK